MARASYPGDLPRATGDSLGDSRTVTFARAWFPNCHIHFRTDFVPDASPVKIRIALFNGSGQLVTEVKEYFVSTAKPLGIVTPPGCEVVVMTRVTTGTSADTAPVGFRLDMWD